MVMLTDRRGTENENYRVVLFGNRPEISLNVNIAVRIIRSVRFKFRQHFNSAVH
jgi:hypothetical protein